MPSRVMIVDNNEDAANSVRMLCEMLGHEAVAFHNAESALEAVETCRPEIVFVDFWMPKLDGIEFARRLRMILSDVRIVLLSGWSDALDAPTQLFERIVQKPIDPQELKALLSESGA